MTPGFKKRTEEALKKAQIEYSLARSLAKAADAAFEIARTKLHERNARLYETKARLTQLEEQLDQDERDQAD